MPAWTVIDIKEGQRNDQDNARFVPTKIVRYKVGKQGPFRLELDADTFTGDKMVAQLDEQAQHILKLMPEP